MAGNGDQRWRWAVLACVALAAMLISGLMGGGVKAPAPAPATELDTVVAECAEEAKQRDYNFGASAGADGRVQTLRSKSSGDGANHFGRCMHQHGYSMSD